MQLAQMEKDRRVQVHPSTAAAAAAKYCQNGDAVLLLGIALVRCWYHLARIRCCSVSLCLEVERSPPSPCDVRLWLVD